MAELPADVVDEAAQLSRLARAAEDPAEAADYRSKRAELLSEHGYAARVRSEVDQPVLVCYPSDWRVDGVVEPDRIEGTERAIERPLTGPGDPDEWEVIEAHNRGIAETVAVEHGDVHGSTAAAFADFMGNHYARRIETAGPRECREFLEDYLPRNAWPTENQLDQAETSLRLVFDAADVEPPPFGSSEE